MPLRRRHLMLCTGLATALGAAGMAMAQQGGQTTSLGSYGTPGLIEMPTANVMPDAELSFTLARGGDFTRGTLAFQVLPRVTGSFRYTAIGAPSSGIADTNYDRSFDVHWQAIAEAGWWPALALGVRDIAGTGLLGGEYLVATRHFGPERNLAVTAGLGWGRLGTQDPMSNPLGAIDDAFDTRPARDVGLGGTVNTGQFFRGDASPFGGIEWQATDRLRLQMEYSSDAYVAERARGGLNVESPLNFGMSYRFNDGTVLGAQYLYGNTFGLTLSFFANPDRPAVKGSVDRAPEPVTVRAPGPARNDQRWLDQPGGPGILQDNITRLFQDDGGLALAGLNLDGTRAVLRVRNLRYGVESQALGRVLRIMTITMPASIETFEVVFVANGLDLSRIRVARSDVEQEHDAPSGAEVILALAEVEDARVTADPAAVALTAPAPGLTWGLSPYVETQLFDPQNPLRLELGLQAAARYDFGNGWIGSGALRASLAGTLDEPRSVTPYPPGAPAIVRSDSFLYSQQGSERIQHLTFSHYGAVAPEIYSRVTLGYMERMFAGLSTELLWQPARSDFGLGLEVNHVWARDYDGDFGLRDYEVTTGHVSAYFPIGDRFRGQLDVGRYLAGDWGATLRVQRTFANGWRVGAFATLTDVPFEAFGEGSFDKGLELEIPLLWFNGRSSRQSQSSLLRPIQRDGGARLNVNERLHEMVTDYQQPNLQRVEGMVWR